MVVNRASLERRAKIAAAHAATAAHLVERQRATLAELAAAGRSTAQADRLLALLEELHRLCLEGQRIADAELTTGLRSETMRNPLRR
jgi:hypothetical protein